jgi:hypothetical protein
MEPRQGKRMRHVWWLLVPTALCLAAPAQARPRDDALAGAVRCAVISDSRQWLDCYYGAAQPVRAALGLAPALAAQVRLAEAPPPGGPLHDEAERDEVVSAAAACMRLTGDRPWLDCFYAAAVPMRAKLGLKVPQTAAIPAPAPTPAPRLAAAPQPAEPAGPPPMPRRIGLFAGLFNSPKPIVRDMPMQSFVLDKQGAFTITLSDGQVWEQSPEDEIYHPARWRREPSEMMVTITPDAMHSYILTVEGEGKIYKVRRIR